MRLLHTSDLHLGRKLGEYTLAEDQRRMLKTLTEMAKDTKADAILLAGDLYDKSAPSPESVADFDAFVTELARMDVTVCAVAGNHDSPERVACYGSLLTAAGVYLAPVYEGTVMRVELSDAYGPVHIHLLPFLKPAQVRRFFPDEPTATTCDAVRTVLRHMPYDPDVRNILLTHQFYTRAGTAPALSDSESVYVGATDNVDAELLEGFDYVAMGHLHRAQTVGCENFRYAGSPLKYSVSEAYDEKSAVLIDLGETCRIETLPITPCRDIRVLRGPIEKLLDDGRESAGDFVAVTLTDALPPPDALQRLREAFPNLLRLDYAALTPTDSPTAASDVAQKSVEQLFHEFYEAQTGTPPDERQSAMIRELLEETL
ncbi:MAG: exonuclease SbcCD subunit D [Clostridiales bacterium]|jgi:exonuclease SbcD|nr:exonuclease SbcCD subunit D [Clostridiales bacterium]